MLIKYSYNYDSLRNVCLVRLSISDGPAVVVPAEDGSVEVVRPTGRGTEPRTPDGGMRRVQSDTALNGLVQVHQRLELFCQEGADGISVILHGTTHLG